MGRGSQFTTTDNVEVTIHARHRWEERTDATVRLEDAWRTAEPISHPAAPRLSAKYTRFYEPEEVVLVAHHDTLVTVFCLDQDPSPTQREVRRDGGES